MRVAVVYDNTVRPDTTGGHCLQALRGICSVEHYLPAQAAQIPRDAFDLYLCIDDGLQWRLPEDLHPCAWWVIDTHLSYDWDLAKAEGFDWVFAAQRAGAERLRADGIGSAQWLPLACSPALHRPWPVPKDLDICFVGNVSSPERARLLGLLGGAFPSHFIGNAYGQQMALMYSRAKLAFNRSVGDDLNMRVFEALACGGLPLTNDLPASGQSDLFLDGQHLVTYSTDEELLAKARYYLEHDAERERIAAAGTREVLDKHTYEHRMRAIVEVVEKGASRTGAPVHGRRLPKPQPYYEFARPELLDLVPAAARRVLDVGCAAGRLGEQLKKRQETHVTGIEMLPQVAVEAATRLDRVLTGDIETMELPEDTGTFDCIVCGDVLEHLRDPRAALRRLLAHLDDDGTLVLSIPNVQNGQVISQLARGRWSYEVSGILDDGHLRFFTLAEVQELLVSLGIGITCVRRIYEPQRDRWRSAGSPHNLELGGVGIQCRCADEANEFFVVQYVLSSRRVRHEPLGGLASIVIPVCNQLGYTAQCISSLQMHTDHPHEVIVVDNGSSDGTPEYLASLPWVKAIRNEKNLGFVQACNQGIEAAAGEYTVLLNNDTILTRGWLARLVEGAESSGDIGMVGPTTNYAAGPQCIDVPYATVEAMHDYAADRYFRHALTTIETERLIGFCLLIKRGVIEATGQLDERFGLGLFDDDDISLRARLAGYRLVYMPGVFIHHFGGKTFESLGIDAASLLESNWQQFRNKWQDHQVAGGEIRRLYRPADEHHSAKAPPTAPQQASPAELPSAARRSGPRKTVSLCMIVRNEEDNLPRCLESAHDLVDEIVVVDTGSTDATKRIAESFGAGTVDFPWIDDFSAARNVSLGHASSEWVLWLDADDSLDEENRAKLDRLLSSPDDGTMAYAMKTICLSGTSLSPTVVDHVRMFRNLPELRFEYRVHEQIIGSVRRLGGRIEHVDVRILHHGYQDPDVRGSKLRRDLMLTHRDLADRPGDPFCLFNLSLQECELGRYAEAISHMEASIALSGQGASPLRKAYATIVNACRKMGDPDRALRACHQGRDHFPDDCELLFYEGLLHHEAGRLCEAEACYLRALGNREPEQFSSLDIGIRGHKCRYNLGLVYSDAGRADEALRQFRLAVDEEPRFFEGWYVLTALLASAGRHDELRALASSVSGRAGLRLDVATLVRARAAMASDDLTLARDLLERALADAPAHVWLQRLLAYVLLQSGDPVAAEPALLRLIELCPQDSEAQRNIDALRSKAGRQRAAVALPEQDWPPACRQDGSHGRART